MIYIFFWPYWRLKGPKINDLKLPKILWYNHDVSIDLFGIDESRWTKIMKSQVAQILMQMVDILVQDVREPWTALLNNKQTVWTLW